MTEAALSQNHPELVLHFHGGLVPATAGRESAARLAPRYKSVSRYPLFFVWESGLLDAVRNNLQDIKGDPLFRELVKKATRWVLLQLPSAAGLKGAGGQVDPKALDTQYDDWFDGTRSELPTAMQPSGADAPRLKGAILLDSETELQAKIRLALEADQPSIKRC